MRTNGTIEIVVNGNNIEIADGSSIADLLIQLELPTRGLAVEVNLEIQSAACFSERILKSGDSLEVVTLVGGG